MTPQKQPAHLERLLNRLELVKRTGDAQWSARCPAHDDRHPSLSIRFGGDKHANAILVNCHAGCDAGDVLAAVGLQLPDLFPDATRRGVVVERRHKYVDASGLLLYAVDRISTHRGRSFRYVHPGTDGRWVNGRGPSSRVLYNLSNLIRNPDLPVWITEGERDADTLAAIGVITTTVASGCWEGVETSSLDGRRVWVVVDNDERGWQRGLQALAVAQSAGALIEGVRRPGDECKDATDWIGEGHSMKDLLHVDLFNEQPPCKTWIVVEPRLEKFESNDGRAYFSMTPKRLSRDDRLSDLAVRAFTILDERAGPSGSAHLTAQALTAILGRRDVRPVTQALRDLTESGYLVREQRGHWSVLNPARPKRSPSFPRDPNTTPRKAREHAGSTNSKPRVSPVTGERDNAGSLSEEDVERELLKTFPGAELVGRPVDLVGRGRP